MSGGLKIRRGGRVTHSSDQFRGIDVTASMSVLALLRRCNQCSAPHGLRYRAGITIQSASGQHRHAAPLSNSSVADTARRLSRKQDHVSANLTGGSISNTLHIVTVSIPRCERGGAGANPAVGTISSSCARQRAEPAVCNTALPSASLGRTSTFHRIRESQQHSLALEARVARGSTGVSDHFHWSVA